MGYSISKGHGVNSCITRVAFKLVPGQSTNITCGGDGWPVTGTVALTLPTNVPADVDLSVSLNTTNGEFHHYEGLVANDRTFRIEDVPPGHYNILITGSLWNSNEHQADLILGIPDHRTVEVPVLPALNPTVSWDLGRIKASVTNLSSSIKPLAEGAQAPDIVTRTANGNPLRLADYRGKFVLLDIRYQFPDRETEGLRTIKQAFAHDDRFAIISLATTVDTAYEHHLIKPAVDHWIIGDLDFSTLPDSYGFYRTEFPLILLIDPDGKIIATELHGDAIYNAVALALANKPQGPVMMRPTAMGSVQVGSDSVWAGGLHLHVENREGNIIEGIRISKADLTNKTWICTAKSGFISPLSTAGTDSPESIAIGLNNARLEATDTLTGVKSVTTVSRMDVKLQK